jgi:hypothetical protein
MLKRGYALLIQLPDDGSFTRCLEFREDVCEYVIADFDPITAAERRPGGTRWRPTRPSERRICAGSRSASTVEAPRQTCSNSQPSPQPALALSQWHQRPAAERALLEKADGHAHLRNKLREVARMRSEWAGIPMPLEGERLVIEPRYPYAGLANIGEKPEPADPEAGWKVRNTFWSTWRRCEVVIFQEANGRITRAYLPGVGTTWRSSCTPWAALRPGASSRRARRCTRWARWCRTASSGST